MPRQPGMPQSPRPASVHDHDSFYSMTTRAGQQPICTPKSTSPASEADDADERLVVGTNNSDDGEQLAASHVNFVVNIEKMRAGVTQLLRSESHHERKKALEWSRAVELYESTRQMAQTINIPTRRRVDNILPATDPSHFPRVEPMRPHRHVPPVQEITHGDDNGPRCQLAAKQHQIDGLRTRLRDQELKSAAQAEQLDQQTAELTSLKSLIERIADAYIAVFGDAHCL
ncbi:hypothetical protein LTR12_010535 [Friedmanniomyces endolithicus]|nr:hypothetical protein LTR74_012627 [Friedmanniomyces endolithicus]KAK1815111.1 hypothetical protein LTR12_010535 [Friedmanniomyces endolithicus]